MPRLSKTSCSVKSPPTTATMPTFVKKLAEIEKCEAEPPRMCSFFPKGVSTSSYATDPTTKRDMCVLVFGFGFLLLFWSLERLQLLTCLFRELAFGIVFDQLVEIVDAHLAKLLRRQRLLFTTVEADVLLGFLFTFVL